MQERLDRAKRRQLLKEDQAFIGKPFDMDNRSIRAVRANTRHLAMMLMDTRLKQRASRAAAFAAGILDATLAKKTEGPVACAKGCYYCCKTYVSVTIPEIFRVADAVRGKAEKTARVRQAAADSAVIPEAEREVRRVVCPILEDKACSEYLPRPLVCRAVLSTSLDTCLRIFEHNSGEMVPFAGNTVDIRGYVVVMMQAALRLAGLPHLHYEMNQALATALDHPDAEARWLAGERLFDHIPIDNADARGSSLTMMTGVLVDYVRPTL
jgi:hypothetical protein